MNKRRGKEEDLISEEKVELKYGFAFRVFLYTPNKGVDLYKVCNDMYNVSKRYNLYVICVAFGNTIFIDHSKGERVEVVEKAINKHNLILNWNQAESDLLTSKNLALKQENSNLGTISDAQYTEDTNRESFGSVNEIIMYFFVEKIINYYQDIFIEDVIKEMYILSKKTNLPVWYMYVNNIIKVHHSTGTQNTVVNEVMSSLPENQKGRMTISSPSQNFYSDLKHD